MAGSFGGTIKLQGESEYKKALKEITERLTVLSSEMKVVTSSYKKGEDSITSLSEKNKILNKKLEEQNKVLSEAKRMLNEAKTSTESNESTILKWTNTVNKAQAEVNKTTRELKENEDAMENLKYASEETNSGLKKIDKSFEDVEKSSKQANSGFTVLKGTLANLVADGFKKLLDVTKEFASSMISVSAEVKAENSQFEQTFGNLQDVAKKSIESVANASGILETRLNSTASSIYAFAMSSGATTEEAMELMQTSLLATADASAYYDRSLEDTAETLKSFLKGNFANDAALGVSATEFTRNAKAVELFGKKYNELTEIQKQQTLLKMVTDAQKLSGAMGQASREADGWENVQGNLNESLRQFKANVGTPFLKALIPVIKSVTNKLKDLNKSIDWNKFGKSVDKAFNKLIDGFSWIKNNGSKIIKILGNIAVAFVTIKTAMMLDKVAKTIQNASLQISLLKMSTDGALTSQVLFNSGLTATEVLVGVLTGKVSLLTVAQGLLTKAWTTFTTIISVNPIVAVATALVGLVAGITAFAKSVEEKYTQAIENVAEGMNKFNESVKSGENHLSKFDDVFARFNERSSEIDDAIKEVQDGITQITELASQERRALTEGEIQKIDEYLEKLKSLQQEELDLALAKSKAIQDQALINAQNRELNLLEYQADAEKWLATAQSNADEQLEIIEKQAINELALINQKYGDKATLDNEEYKKEVERLNAQKEEKITKAKETLGLLYNEYSKGFTDRLDLQDKMQKVELSRWADGFSSIEEENKAHTDEINNINTLYADNEKERNRLLEEEEERHKKFLSKAYAKGIKDMSEEEQEQLGVWLSMVANTELYGGQIDEETQKTFDSLILAFDSLPDKTKDTMKDALTPMLDEMENKSPSLFAKAKGIADGIISRLKKSFDIHSPSKKTRDIFKNVMLGMEEGIDEEKKSIFSQISSFGKNVVSKLNNSIDTDKIKGLGLSFELENISSQINSAIPSSISADINAKVNNDISKDKYVSSFKEALSQMKIELDDEVAGRFVEDTVTNLVYS